MNLPTLPPSHHLFSQRQDSLQVDDAVIVDEFISVKLTGLIHHAYSTAKLFHCL